MPAKVAVIEELAFGARGQRNDHIKGAVLMGCLLAAPLTVMIVRARAYRRLQQVAAHRSRQPPAIPVT
jgi:hypothetical protein